ncbi:ASCH domain-containing protein [Nocardioides sp. NPDC058538]|uniref:ASCH domain-containing protein n=1 Tax=Nocardioides sp. NPDC058538 TaxID=3346542 RepID=UPI003663EA05
MAGAAIGRVALFSIHPTYAEAILDGSKQVEFRRQALRSDVSHVIIYATSPRKRIVGVFEVDGVDAVSPRQAWAQYRTVGGIDKASFDRYYEGAARAYVIRVRTAHATARPFALAEIDDELRPPQSYQYLRGAQLEQAHRLLTADQSRPGMQWRLAAAGQQVLAGTQ